MHADERNKALSDELGRDVYHYHLHVIYIPVVPKEVYYQKTNKDPALAGKLKEVIPQISHSKKWPIRVPVERDGKTIILNEYSLLQDRFFEHMRSAGFEGFERGERGSTAEHLSVVEFKTKQEMERAAAIAAEAAEMKQEVSSLAVEVESKQERSAALDVTVGKQEKQIERNEKKLEVQKTAILTAAEIEAIGKPSLLGNISLPPEDMKKLKSMAKKSVANEEMAVTEKRRRVAAERKLNEVTAELAEERKRRPSLTESLAPVNRFLAALARAPKRLMEVINDIMKQPPEKEIQQQARQQKHKQEVL
jgi:hypothetical protein